MTHSHLNQRVSIIIPAFRGERFIADALLSVESQSYSNWEVIIVEDGSCDGTESIVNQFKLKHSAEKIRFIRHANNRGVAKARNTAIDAATGRYLAFLDCDDHWHPEHLEMSLDAIHLSDADFCHSAIEFFDWDVRECRPAPRIDLNDDDWKSRIYFANFIALSSVVIRNTERGTAGWFNESRSVNHAEDYELWLRLALEGKRLTYNPRTTVSYRVHPNQASHNSAIIFVWGTQWEYHVVPRSRNPLKRWFYKRPGLPASRHGGVLSDDELVKMYSRSRINLGFSTCGESHVDDVRIVQIRLRDFEIPMSGGFYLVEYQPELEEFFEVGKEIECYRNQEELLDKCRFYLRNDVARDKIRTAGRNRCLRDHTWKHRFETSFEAMGLH